MVKDRGCGIADLEQACRPMFTTGGEERSGMGITIMESFMTEFRITLRAGQGYDRPYEAPDRTPRWKKVTSAGGAAAPRPTTATARQERS